MPEQIHKSIDETLKFLRRFMFMLFANDIIFAAALLYILYAVKK